MALKPLTEGKIFTLNLAVGLPLFTAHVNQCAGWVAEEFFIPGPPVGYYAAGGYPNWTRQKEYHAYRDTTRKYALAAGILTPFAASMEHHVYIFTRAVFFLGKRFTRSGNFKVIGAHPDSENVRKGICDALFYGGSGDRYTGGAFNSPEYTEDEKKTGVSVLVIREKAWAERGAQPKKLKIQTPMLPGFGSSGRKKKPRRWGKK